jgi:hypothetical protein
MFFEKFDRENLAFLYQEKTAEGEVSRFHKFVEREPEMAKSSGKKESGEGSKPAMASKRSIGARASTKASSSSRQAQSEPKKRASSKKA